VVLTVWLVDAGYGGGALSIGGGGERGEGRGESGERGRLDEWYQLTL
jgi:hypothetical protein